MIHFTHAAKETKTDLVADWEALEQVLNILKHGMVWTALSLEDVLTLFQEITLLLGVLQMTEAFFLKEGLEEESRWVTGCLVSHNRSREG